MGRTGTPDQDVVFERQSPWKRWVQFSLSAVAGAAVALVGATLSYSETRRLAEDGDERSASNRGRIERLELLDAANAERWNSLRRELAEMKGLLRKLADRED